MTPYNDYQSVKMHQSSLRRERNEIRMARAAKIDEVEDVTRTESPVLRSVRALTHSLLSALAPRATSKI